MTGKVVSLEVYRQKRILKEIDEPDAKKTELLSVQEKIEVLSEFYGIPDDYEGDDE